jgi:hypothetical protein
VTLGAWVSLLADGALPLDPPGRWAGVPLLVTWIDPFMLGWIEQMKS